MPAQVTFTVGKLHAPSMDTATCEEKFKNVACGVDQRVLENDFVVVTGTGTARE
jgi:hypothetical protein